MKKSTVMQFLPDLARAGLIKNEPWVLANCNAAEAMFTRQPILSATAIVISAVHPTGIEVLQQAPIIAAALSKNMDKRVPREVLARDFRQRLQLLPKLRGLLESLSIPKQLRIIRAGALISDIATTIPHLANVNPSTLAQSLTAEDIVCQNLWLVAVHKWCEHFERRNRGEVAHLDWLLKHLVPTRDNLHTEIVTIADFAITNPAQFNPRWTWSRALDAAREWHHVLQHGDAIRDFERTYRRHVDYKVDYDHLSQPFGLPDGFSIVPLRSGRDLIEEGKTMHHCVASYAQDVLDGRSRIFSVRKHDKPVATLELARDREVGSYRGKRMYSWRTVQLQGPCNDPVSHEVREAVSRFIDSHRRQAWIEGRGAPQDHPHITGGVPPSGRAGYGGRGVFMDVYNPHIVSRELYRQLQISPVPTEPPARNNPLMGGAISEFSGIRFIEQEVTPRTVRLTDQQAAQLRAMQHEFNARLEQRMERAIFLGTDMAHISPTDTDER